MLNCGNRYAMMINKEYLHKIETLRDVSHNFQVQINHGSGGGQSWAEDGGPVPK